MGWSIVKISDPMGGVDDYDCVYVNLGYTLLGHYHPIAPSRLP